MAFTMIDDAVYEVQKNMKKESRRVFFKNFKTIHHRIVARFLRKRGWVVFYLEEEARKCKDMCWLKLYQDEEKRKGG